jgi:undecaprenyl-diphosphatase
MLCGLGFSAAAEFSFLLSIPAILGALLLETMSAGPGMTGAEAAMLAVSATVAFVSGYAALRLLVWILGRGSFHRFSWYLIPAGTAAFIWFASRA